MNRYQLDVGLCKHKKGLHIHEKLFCEVKSELGRCLLCAAIMIMLHRGEDFISSLSDSLGVDDPYKSVQNNFKIFFLCPKFKTRHKNTFS